MPVGKEKYEKARSEKCQNRSDEEMQKPQNGLKAIDCVLITQKKRRERRGVSHEMVREARGRERNRKIWEGERERERGGGNDRKARALSITCPFSLELQNRLLSADLSSVHAYK